MKYFLHNISDDQKQNPVQRGDASTCDDSTTRQLDFAVAGPFTSVNSLHQWRRVTVHFKEPLQEGASIELATLAHEVIHELGSQRLWRYRPMSAEKQMQLAAKLDEPALALVKFVDEIATHRHAVFGAVDVDSASSRTPLLCDALARRFAKVLGADIEVPKLNKTEKEIRSQLDGSIRRYPLGASDVTIWHQPGKRQGRGTQIWVLMRIGYESDCKKPALNCVEVESQESGWERDLPQIYQESNPEDVQDGRSAERSGMPILLESLLRLFEFNADRQREEIQRIADWFVPELQTTDPARLAKHLGVPHEGLTNQQLLDRLPSALDRFLNRGTKDSLLEALRTIYSDDREPHQMILELREPIKTCRVMVLDDPKCRLDDPNVVLSGVESRAGSDAETEGPALQLTGLQHLVGRAILRVNAEAFSQDPERDRLRRMVDSLAPAHMRIVIQYVGDPGILGFGAVVGECTVG